MFFNIAGNPALTSGGAAVTSGSSIVNGSGDVGDHWAYNSSVDTSAAVFGDRDDGISAVGYGLAGLDKFHLMSGNIVNGQPNGVDWMIGPSDFSTSTCQGTTCDVPIIVNLATFTLVIPSGTTLNLASNIAGVVFQWDTSLEPFLNPEPWRCSASASTCRSATQ